jgi:hypothetical protein
MRNDGAAIRDLWGDSRQDGSDVFVGQSMKAISLQARLTEAVRKRDQFGHDGLPAVKAGVETGNLWHSRQSFKRGFDRSQIVGLVQWRQWHQLSQLSQNLRAQSSRSAEMGSAVNDAVTDTDYVRSTVSRAEP